MSERVCVGDEAARLKEPLLVFELLPSSTERDPSLFLYIYNIAVLYVTFQGRNLVISGNHQKDTIIKREDIKKIQ